MAGADAMMAWPSPSEVGARGDAIIPDGPAAVYPLNTTPRTRRMNQEQFWNIIAEACRSDVRQSERWDGQLQAVLSTRSPDEIIEWNHIFDRLAAQAYTVDLWAAAYIINGGASDDGFYYFRCWLICMGQEVYEAAILNPDSLADVVVPGIDAEAETYAAAHGAWMTVTGRPDTDPYPARNESAELRGEDWDFDNEEEVQKRLPRLAALSNE
jgi:hypothetical protein